MPDRDTFEVLPWRPARRRFARMSATCSCGRRAYEGTAYVMRRAMAGPAMGFDHLPRPELSFTSARQVNGSRRK